MTMDDRDATLLWKPDPSANLLIQKGPQAGISFPLFEGEVVIGRGSDIDIVLEDRLTSRRHARISWRGGQASIEDLGSSNGTFVNSQKLTGKRQLNSNDQIRLGKAVTLVYEAPRKGKSAQVEEEPGETVARANPALETSVVSNMASNAC